ncbi:uncharacterized protein LOC130645293 [Hydractinia symbiolongicarpus]|uniref:uncharacterized protein LOC130645293 n=1 Tax=Hydractinia symbiolongicarpus TaxID=13093 RepID=UPI00254B00ED|nr:uncharacterized protein LOC130645293 [Hydractinia symbiolongicarpus]XP_057307224.1 uncharacterized protein LOC130645293 [Hydractinia symbiolongicarpus]
MLKWQKLSPQLKHDKIQRSLKDIIKTRQLPIVVTITLPCFLRTKEVLKNKQPIAILNRKEVHLLTGHNERNVDFKFNADDNLNSLVETFEQIQPKSVEEITSIFSYRDIVVVRKDCVLRNIQFRAGDKLLIAFLHSSHTTEKTFALLCRQDNWNYNVSLLADILLDDDLFIWLRTRERLKLRTLLRAFEPQWVRFVHKSDYKLLPAGIVFLRSIKTCDLILTATCCGQNVRYETYPLNSKIMAELSFNNLPHYVKCLGKGDSSAYTQSIARIETLFHYDIYGPRFYGFLDEMNAIGVLESCNDPEK